MEPYILKYHSTDTGFCQIFYSTPEKPNQPLLCFQDIGVGGKVKMHLMRCTPDGEAVDSFSLDSIKKHIKFEKPDHDKDMSDQVIQILKKANRLWEVE